MPFALLFTAPTWAHVQVLLTGTLLAQGGAEPSALVGPARRADSLGLSMRLLPPGWPLVVAVDETLERRTGAQIAAKGMSRDAVRSSHSKVVTWALW